MSVELIHFNYDSLDSRQKENYNFQKVSGVLADYGYSTVRLTQDWAGADFVAQHADGVTFLRVQLKGRLTFKKDYIGKDLWICFRDGHDVYLFPHDKVLDLLLSKGRVMNDTYSWETKGWYSWLNPPKWFKPLLEEYRLQAKEKARP